MPNRIGIDCSIKMRCPKTNCNTTPDICSHYGIHDRIYDEKDGRIYSGDCMYTDDDNGCPKCVAAYINFDMFIEEDEMKL